ncbi:DUF4248 domain-containing protein [Bacteroides sp. 224]|uniref:DUF4248 domain-containing protein n=1 Tax=Bacteroides sp. 224 TaxID=2302936 RepID=UPI0013D46AC2|nr:DUF4248 domain-containing protein [Bacteroides sp. 224]NDV66757.1 DUF4248 domain-containing protein [Bacteroides sp. 224]
MDNEKMFVVKTYLKAELAMMYHPTLSKDAAMYKMKKWILHNDELREAYSRIQGNPRDHYYTPKQVELIVKYLGVPVSHTY